MIDHRLCPTCDRMKPSSHFYARSGKPRCGALLKWTQGRRFKLMTLVDEGKNEDQIAKILDTTPTAVHLAKKRYRIKGVYSHSLSGRAVARMMGVGCEKTVTKWIEADFLKGKRIRNTGPNKSWLIAHTDLYAFVEDERTWHLWSVDRIADRMLRRYAERVRGDVRFLRTGEVAEHLYTQPGTVTKWIAKGWMPARRWGNWWVDSRDVARFELPHIGGHRKVA